MYARKQLIQDHRGQRKHVEYAAFRAPTKSLEKPRSANLLSEDEGGTAVIQRTKPKIITYNLVNCIKSPVQLTQNQMPSLRRHSSQPKSVDIGAQVEYNVAILITCAFFFGILFHFVHYEHGCNSLKSALVYQIIRRRQSSKHFLNQC